MNIIRNLNLLREELSDLVIIDEAILHDGEILNKSQELDNIINIYYKQSIGEDDGAV
jgi:hypothetical protein